ncbi:type II toxin-antitoxin system HicA family toxin [Methanofollis liminatans]|uniref:type II toxin-antitoxin system HicA family toxin n=1 Tax=Methanofollis liminatans TaxID=2201 RepID=UPI0009FFEEF2
MTGLPVISGDSAIRSFEKLGYQVVRQRGSHVRLVHPDQSKKPLTIPRHEVLGKGLLRKLLRDADISPEEFSTLLQ